MPCIRPVTQQWRPVTPFAQTKPKSLDYFLADWFLLFLSLHPLRSCIPHEFPSNHLHMLHLFTLPSHHPSVNLLRFHHFQQDLSQCIARPRQGCQQGIQLLTSQGWFQLQGTRVPVHLRLRSISWHAYVTWIEGMEWKNGMKHMILLCHHILFKKRGCTVSMNEFSCWMLLGTSSEVTWDREKHPEMNWQQCIFRSLSCFGICELSNLDFWTCSRSPLRALCSRRQAPKANPKSSSFNDRRNKDTLRHQVLNSVCSYQQ